MSSYQEVVNTILEHLGRSFRVMCHVRRLVAIPHGQGGIRFQYPSVYNKHGYNNCCIVLNYKDLYDVTFERMNRMGDILKHENHHDIQASDLQDLFEEVTGLFTTMQPRD